MEFKLTGTDRHWRWIALRFEVGTSTAIGPTSRQGPVNSGGSGFGNEFRSSPDTVMITG